MLAAIGVRRFDDLIAPVPETLRLPGLLDVPGPYSEYDIARRMDALASRNEHGGSTLAFLGAGSYDHFIPAAVDHVSFRSEYYTAYTPYQAEVGQGTLTTIFEFQTMLAELTGMDLANASMYDGASALAEAALLAASVTGRTRIVVAGALHPNYLRVLSTYCGGQGIDVVVDPCPEGAIDRGWLRDHLADAAAVVAQMPNLYGMVEDLASVFADARAAGARTIQVFPRTRSPCTRRRGRRELTSPSRKERRWGALRPSAAPPSDSSPPARSSCATFPAVSSGRPSTGTAAARS
jgi:glycine dehydrogenase subunit 1